MIKQWVANLRTELETGSAARASDQEVYWEKRRIETAKEGCRAMISAMQKRGLTSFDCVFENMTYPDGKPFPGRWLITFTKTE